MNLPHAPGVPDRIAQETLRAWSEGEPDQALARLDPEGRIVDWDEKVERVEGHLAASVVGRLATDLWCDGEPGPEPGVGLSPALDEASAFGRSARVGHRRRFDGTRFSARVVLIPLRDPDGELLGFAQLTRALNDAEPWRDRALKAEAERDEFLRRKDEFLAMLAHELRNPLAPVLHATQILRIRAECAETSARMRTLIEQQVHHMARLIDDLVDVSRVTCGKIRLRSGRVDLAEIASRSREAARPWLEAGGHALTVAMPAAPLAVMGDATRLEQILTSLLSNAAKYTDDGGSIRLTIERDGDEAVLRVVDSGIGIAAPLLPRVFDLFTQADCTLDRSGGGLGIGLTLVRSLVLLHGGTVQARSPGLGQGSEFIVRLPALDDAPTAQPGHTPAASGATAAERPILIVDDNVSAATSLAMLVKLWGYGPLVAHDGPKALEMARDHGPPIVLLDIGLPGMDGLEVARRLRQIPVVAGSTIVAMTGYGQDDDRKRSREAGFDHHLVKPVDLDALERLIAGPAHA